MTRHYKFDRDVAVNMTRVGVERILPTHPKKDFVCFARSFAYESAPNLTHMTLDGARTARGRTGWATTEGWDASNGPACLRCRKAWGAVAQPRALRELTR